MDAALSPAVGLAELPWPIAAGLGGGGGTTTDAGGGGGGGTGMAAGGGGSAPVRDSCGARDC